MYAEHVPIIAAGMRHDAATFQRGIMFAILSARSQFVRVPDMLADWQAQGAASPDLWGWKRDSHDDVMEYGAALWPQVCAMSDAAAAILLMSRAIRGLGIVKAGFVAQLMGFDVGCLDARNIERLGLNPRAYRTDGATRKGRPAYARKAARYVAETGGRAQELWDAWCREIGVVYKKTPDEISADHLCVVSGRLRRKLLPFDLAHANVSDNTIPF